MYTIIPRLLGALSLAVLLTTATQAETVIKIDLGSDSTADMQLAGGIFSTTDNLNAATTGHQDTSLLVLDFLDPYQADINNGTASFSLTGVTAAGPTVILATTAFQPTTGGTFEIYSPTNVLLLRGILQDGTLSGPVGGSRTGSFLTAVFGTFTGGTLAPYLSPNSASLAISLTGIRSAGNLPGLQVANNALLDFSADATANIGALVPEPATASCSLIGLLALIQFARRRTS